MVDTLQGAQVQTAPGSRIAHLVRASQVARDTEVRQSSNGVRFATFGETGVADLDLDRMLEAVPTAVVVALRSNTYYFVPLALREAPETAGAPSAPELSASPQQAGDDEEGLRRQELKSLVPSPEELPQPAAMVASAYTDEFSDAAICHRNVELGQGRRAVFISTRLMNDRFALSFEFFINVAHAFVEQAGVPEAFAELVWKQALENVRGETSLDAWESRNLTFGRPANAMPESTPVSSRRGRGFSSQRSFTDPAASPAFSRASGNLPKIGAPFEAAPAFNEKERRLYLEAAFSDALAIYLLSLALDFEYGELREREYPLLSPAGLATRLRKIAELFPPNRGYEFAVRYRRRA